MKNIRYFLLLAMTMLFAACSQDDLEDIQPSVPQEGGQDGELVEINVSMDARDTRVEYHEESPNFTWDAGDELLVLGYNASNACQFAETFTMKEGTNTGNSATFVGKLRTIDKIKVFYKAANLRYNIEEADGGVKIDYAGQKQAGKDSSAHLKPYLLIGTADYTTNARLMSRGLTLTMLNSLLRVDAKSMPAEIGALNKLEVLSNYGTENEQLASINVEGYTAQDGASVLYMAFDPVTMAQNATSSLRLSFGGDKHYCVQADNTKATLNQAGHRYRLTVAATAEELQGGKGLTNWAVENVRISTLTHTLTIVETGSVTPELIDQAMNGTGKLKVVGGINGADLKAIRERAGATMNSNLTFPADEDIKLSDLDLSEATFVVSNDVYYVDINFEGSIEYKIQKTNEIPAFAFSYSHLKSLILPTSPEITTIGEYAMNSNENLTAIVFPQNITTLGTYCCNFTNIQQVTLPSTITTVGKAAFSNSLSLTTVYWNATCPVIPQFCFDGANIVSVFNISEGVTTIESTALDNMWGLETLVLPRSMTQIKCLPPLTSLTIKAPYSENFQMDNFFGVQNCDLTLDGSWAPYVTGNEWNGATWKSIAYIGEVDSSPLILLNEAEKQVLSSAGNYSFTFNVQNATTAQPTIEVQAGADWLKNPQMNYADGAGTVNYSVDANEAAAKRQATITVKYEGAVDKVYTVKQAGKPQPTIVLSEPQKQITNASADLSFTFIVENPTTGNPTLEKQADAAWLNNVQLISFANNTGTVNYSVDANEAETPRQATITVKYEGAVDQVYTIIQNGKSNKLASATFNNTGVLVGIPAQERAGVTYEALVNFSSFNANNTVIGQEEVFLLRLGDSDKDNNQIHVCFDNLDEQGEATYKNGSLLSNARLNANQWYHLAATIKPSGDGVEVALYVNGILDKSQVFPGVSMPVVGGNGKALDTDNHHGTTKNYNAKRGVFIGRLVDYAWGDRAMNGMMREARVWSEARTADQIKNNMLSVDATSEGLEAYYKFDGNDVAGTTVTDASGKGHNGTVKAGNITSTEHAPIVL